MSLAAKSWRRWTKAFKLFLALLFFHLLKHGDIVLFFVKCHITNHFNIYKGKHYMDGRILVVFIPVIGAAIWVVYNIGRVALQQFKKATR